MAEVHAKYVRLFSSFRLRTLDIVIISVSAGVGEELFFRGAVQPYLGVLWTAVAFVALHGYLNPKDWRMTTYGLLMTAIIVALGYMTEYVGIVSAMLAHVVIDLVLLCRLREADFGAIN
jgi:membrane protease YdiL (CAAX protease family)